MPAYKNRTYINNLDSKLQEALDDIVQQIQNLAPDEGESHRASSRLRMLRRRYR
jgi:hypothetical protein